MTESADRKLVLLRHAKSAWPDLPDHERPLAGRGRRDAPVMGRWLRAGGHVPDQVLCSTARRARETWQLAPPGLGCRAAGQFTKTGCTRPRRHPAAGPGPARIAGGWETLLIVGHDPGIPGLALLLAGAAAPADGGRGSGAVPQAVVNRMRAKFPTAAIAVLELAGPWDQLRPGTRLTRFVTPRDVGPI